jgi:hypothetical protein
VAEPEPAYETQPLLKRGRRNISVLTKGAAAVLSIYRITYYIFCMDLAQLERAGWNRLGVGALCFSLYLTLFSCHIFLPARIDKVHTRNLHLGKGKSGYFLLKRGGMAKEGDQHGKRMNRA